MDISQLPDLSEFPHHMPIQLRFSDVDVLGHVNNTVYLAFYDTGKAGYFNAIRGKKADWNHVDTVIANVDCAFVDPIVFGNDIEVYTRCSHVGEKSFRLQQVLVDIRTGKLKSAAETVMVAIDRADMKATQVPEDFRNQLLNSK